MFKVFHASTKKLRLALVGTAFFAALALSAGSSQAGPPCTAIDYCAESDALCPSDAESFYLFGRDIAISGNVMIVSAMEGDCDTSQPCGAAYIYRFDGIVWEQEAKLIDVLGDQGDGYGVSVAVDGDVAVVGALFAGDNPQQGGAALIFRKNGSSWIQEARLTGQNMLGWEVKIQGEMALISEQVSSPVGDSSGVVHIYRKNGSTWTLEDTLEPTVAGNHANFGSNMALGNGVLAVGAYSTPHPTSYGAVYLYQLVGQQWVERQVINGTYFRNTLGESLSLSGDLLFISGIQEANPDTGIGYIYRYNGLSWTLEDTVIPSGATEFDGFAVAIAGDLAVVGARHEGCDSDNQCGAAYLFQNSGGSWTEIAKLRGAMAPSGHYGWSVAIDGHRIFVGAPGDSHPQGTPFRPGLAYYYDFSIVGADCDCDSVADSCALVYGAEDCNGNTVPDSCDITTMASTDCDTNDVPDECQADCQPNGVADTCDIVSQTSIDCNANSIPDECESTDCNGNLVPDDCDIASAESLDCNGNGTPDECEVAEFDCNSNSVPDECDIASGFSQDANGDGYPDECTIDPPGALVADPSGLQKSRFVSFQIPTVTGVSPITAMRVWMVSLHNVVPPYNGGPTIPFTAFEGDAVWVGPPSSYAESSSNPALTFRASRTQCTPHYQDWSTVGLLHVRGSHIVPSSIYEVEQVSAACQGQEDSCTTVSVRLEIRTTRWGDVTASFNPPAITAQPDIADCSSLVAKFRSTLGAPVKARAFLAGSTAFGEISNATLSNDLGFAQIAAVVDGFRGSPYPYKMGRCAVSLPPPSTNACSTDAECGANGPCNLYCPN